MELFQAGSDYHVSVLTKGVQTKSYFAEKGSRIAFSVVEVTLETNGF